MVCVNVARGSRDPACQGLRSRVSAGAVAGLENTRKKLFGHSGTSTYPRSDRVLPFPARRPLLDVGEDGVVAQRAPLEGERRLRSTLRSRLRTLRVSACCHKKKHRFKIRARAREVPKMMAPPPAMPPLRHPFVLAPFAGVILLACCACGYSWGGRRPIKTRRGHMRVADVGEA